MRTALNLEYVDYSLVIKALLFFFYFFLMRAWLLLAQLARSAGKGRCQGLRTVSSSVGAVAHWLSSHNLQQQHPQTSLCPQCPCCSFLSKKLNSAPSSDNPSPNLTPHVWRLLLCSHIQGLGCVVVSCPNWPVGMWKGSTQWLAKVSYASTLVTRYSTI